MSELKTLRVALYDFVESIKTLGVVGDILVVLSIRVLVLWLCVKVILPNVKLELISTTLDPFYIYHT